MLAIVCPGQGAQSPGFLQPWLELPGAREQLEALGEIAEVDLIAHGTVSDAETIKDTAVAQPLIVAAGLVSAKALWPGGITSVSASADSEGPVLAGHSVGEITAAALAGVLSEASAMSFVAARARGMAGAAAAEATGMSAVVGGVQEEVLAAIEQAGLTPANLNSSGQTVAAGTLERLAALAADPPARARVIPLSVAGAFHTEHMTPAIANLAALAGQMQPQDPQLTLLSNFDGASVASGSEVLQSLVAQVCRPVRWDACMATMLELGVDRLIELSPAGTLTGLAKRSMPGVRCVAVKTPADLDAARELLDLTPATSCSGSSRQFTEGGH